tara:strand:- start:1614 stop:2099 length:486 start_codon:yes stop_codon:yes gene_type:complete
MKNFFDDVFDNKIFFEKEELLRTFNDRIKEEETLLKEDVTDSSLENLMQEMRENPERPFTKKESMLIKARLESAKEKCKGLIQTVKDQKETIDRTIRESGRSFTLDISKNSSLRKSATNTFGGIKTEITYDNYMTLVELKRMLELSETLDMIDEVAENGNI